ncbi:MAG: hypothetical protein WBA76_20100 [Phormidesmis sp.]
MASLTDVKTYLAHWFQLGRKVKSDHGRLSYQPEKVIQGEHFSPEFEDCWAAIMAAEGKSLYLEGTDQTIAELLSPTWEVVNCARCEMPIPILQKESKPHSCPCHDLPDWPNEEVPRPRLPVSSYQHLRQMKNRLAGLSPDR